MPGESLSLNRAIVFGSGIIYWAGVWVQARRIRRRTGRSTNTRPRGLKERLLWAGWFFVVLAWLGLPLLGALRTALPGTVIVASLVHPVVRGLGMFMMAAGYAGTLWCYIAMGNSWRMGIDRTEKTDLVTRGPYRFVRHPIYLCQAIMVAAIPLLLPCLLALFILVTHLLCVRIKAADEESHLRTLLGGVYETYCARTGRWFPHLGARQTPLSASERIP
jgi:protein-S-isoprenylcysteine O-methyltransferase Ste14